MKIRKFLILLGIVLLVLQGCSTMQTKTNTTDITLQFPTNRYPQTGAHIKDAISKGHSAICTLDRKGVSERRKQSLASTPAKHNVDRDEWPMAMCEEGGKGADIRYINPSDNRGAGSWIGNQLDKYPDGTRVKFIIE